MFKSAGLSKVIDPLRPARHHRQQPDHQKSP